MRIFLDVDDTVLNSSETVIDILNKRYGLNKSLSDLKDWNYASICKTVSKKEIDEIYNSDEFFNNVRFKKEFLDFYKTHTFHNIRYYYVTKGTEENLFKKYEYLKKSVDGDFVGLRFLGEEDNSFDKSMVDMKDGIQIDDRFDCLATTNAAVKILIKNDLDVYWNKIKYPVDNLYCVRDWKEAIEIIEFALNNGWFLGGCL